MLIDLTHSSPLQTCIQRADHIADDDFDFPNAEAYFNHAPSRTVVTPRLFQLPVEILVYIIESGLSAASSSNVGLPRQDLHYLQTIRKVHPLLAQLSFVRATLFRQIYLTTNPDELKSMERGIGGITPYIRRIVFKPATILRSQLPIERQRDYVRTIEKLGAPKVQRALDSGRFLKIWVDLLKQCPRAEMFHVTSFERSTYSDIKYGLTGHVLLTLVLQVLIASKCRIRELSLQHLTEEEFVFTKLQEWEDLDLTALESLTFDFSMQSMSRRWDYRKSFNMESVATLLHLMHASRSRLRHLALSAISENFDTLLHLPCVGAALPLLTSLKLCDGQIDPITFAAWIPTLAQLKQVTLGRVRLTRDSELKNWHPVFEALRDHSGNLLVEMPHLSLLCAAGYHGSIVLHHQIPTSPKSVPQAHPILAEISDMLKMYLSRLEEWNEEEYWSIDHYHPPEMRYDIDLLDRMYPPSDEDEEDDPLGANHSDSSMWI